MNCRFVPLLFAAALAGCATFDKTELAQVRQRGVSPQVYHKLDRGAPLSPADVIELTHRGVPDRWIIRQLEDNGVDSVITRSDIRAMRLAGVRAEVIDAALIESARFSRDYSAYPDYGGDPYYYGGWSYPYSAPWYWGFGPSFVFFAHGHHHHHHW